MGTLGEEHRHPKLDRTQFADDEPRGSELVRMPHEGVELIGHSELEEA